MSLWWGSSLRFVLPKTITYRWYFYSIVYWQSSTNMKWKNSTHMKVKKAQKRFTKEIHWVKHSIRKSRQYLCPSPRVLVSNYPMSIVHVLFQVHFIMACIQWNMGTLYTWVNSGGNPVAGNVWMDSGLNPVASNVLHKYIALSFLVLARTWWTIKLEDMYLHQWKVFES